MSPTKLLDKKTLLFRTAEFSLAICLIYTLFYLASSLGLQYSVLSNRSMVAHTASGSVLSGPLDVAVWGIAIFVVLVWLGLHLELKNVKEFSRTVSGAGLLVFLCGLGVWVCLVILGFVVVWSLVLVSGLLLGLCFVFSVVFFGVGRLVFSLRVLFGGLLLVLFFELASFVLFNGPFALGLDVGGLGLHWSGVELVFANLTYPFLPYVYLLFVLFGVGAFVFRVFPKGWLWLVGRVRGGWFVSRLRGLFLLTDGGFGFFCVVDWLFWLLWFRQLFLFCLFCSLFCPGTIRRTCW